MLLYVESETGQEWREARRVYIKNDILHIDGVPYPLNGIKLVEIMFENNAITVYRRG